MSCTGLEDSPQTSLETVPGGLRVCYPDGKDRTLPMPTARATLGAGAGCTILIRHPGVAPLHCVLTPTSNGCRVRRWADNTLLNGETFTETSVEAGDRLQLGPVAIEFLAEPPEPSSDDVSTEASAARSVTASWATNGCRQPAGADSRPALDRTGIDATFAEHFRRLEELTQKLNENVERQRSAEQELSALREHIQDIRHESARAEQLHVATREAIVELGNQFAEMRQARSNGHAPSSGGYRSARRVLPEGLRQRLVERAGEAELERGVAVEQPPVESPPAEQAVDHDADVDSSGYDPDLWEAPQNGHSSQQLAVMPDREVAEAPDSETPDAESAEASVESLIVAETESEASPESFLEKYQHLLRDDATANSDERETAAEAPRSVAEPPTQVSIAAAEESSHASAPHDDDSIESYMTRLFQRIRGEPIPNAGIDPESTGDALICATTASSKGELAQPAVKPVTDLSEIKSTVAPEKSCDMAALRDLANQSARGAVQTAHLKEQLENVLIKLLVSLLAVICGLVVMDLASHYVSFVFGIGVVLLIAGLTWGSRMVWLVLYAIREGSIALPIKLRPQKEEPSPVPPDVSADEL